LKACIIEKKRLYIFPEAVLGKTCGSGNAVLKNLNNNSQFWERKFVERGV
jgi:hypothetical protein